MAKPSNSLSFFNPVPTQRPARVNINVPKPPSPGTTRSSSPNLHHRSNALPTDGTDVDLLRTLLARRHMPAVVEQGVHLFLVAYITHGHFLVRHLKLHRALAVPFPFLEPTNIDVSRFGVDHLALPVRLVRLPLSRICVPVCVRHRAKPTDAAGNKVARVRVTDHGHKHARTVRTTVFLGNRHVRAAKVRLHTLIFEITGVILITEPCKEIDRIRALALALETGNPET